jgi:DNA-binding transcriptional ArsR family regulator
MSTPAALARLAALLADPARAAMAQALMAGQALTAGELARAASVAPPTATAHLAKLVDGGLVAVHAQGRHRFFRIADAAAATALEGMMVAAASPRAPWSHGEGLRDARTCWDHLAGRLGVALHAALVGGGLLRPAPGGWALSGEGEARFAAIGLDLAAAHRAPRLAADCMDWSERVPHLGGGFARALCAHCVARGWVRRGTGEGLARRLATITPEGARAMRDAFGLSWPPASSRAATA